MNILKGTIAIFENPEVGASVLPVIQGELKEDEATFDHMGKIELPSQECKMVTGFCVILRIQKESRLVIVQRALDRSDRRYHQHALTTQSEIEGDWDTWVMLDHIKVSRQAGISWTRWTGTVPNRIDLWFLDEKGQAQLFQVGVVARGDNDDLHFRLLGELRGVWQLCCAPRQNNRTVGVPVDPVWGKFDVRRDILNHPDFKALLVTPTLPEWKGFEEELDPPLNSPPAPGYAVMEWWSPFAGMRGQGPCRLHDPMRNIWVCGEDYLGPPDSDGIVRLPRGTLVSYKEISQTVHPEEGRVFAKLTQVRRVERVRA